jgi:hypothetical protein
MKTTFTPHILTIKVFSSGPIGVTPKQLSELLSSIGPIVDITATPMTFDGDKLVPTVAAPIEEAAPAAPVKVKAKSKPKDKAPTARSAQAAQVASRAASKDTKPISFTEGSDPEKIWHLIRNSMSMTSTQIREKLDLQSGIVNTTIYRLKGAGMIRPMSHKAPNGDTLYTSTEWDVPAKPEVDNDE